MKNDSKADIKLPSRPNPQFNSIKEFSLGEELGEGAIASVFLATHTPSGKKYAVKDVEISTLSEQDFENVEKELEIHSTLDHPYIIKMLDFFKENGHVYIVLNLAQNGNLFKFLTKNNPLNPEDIGKFWTQTAKAIQYLHSKQILMRDLKPENLLLDENMNIKVCDFGWATRMNDLEYKKLKGGTFAYMSPETLEGKDQGFKSDVWSLGILLFELYHNREPFTPGDNCEEQLYFLKIGRVVYKMGLDRIVSNLIEKLLEKDHTKRITLDDVFNDPFTIPYVKNLQSGNTFQPRVQPQQSLKPQQSHQSKKSLQNQRSIQNSQTSFRNQNLHLQNNLLSQQHTFKNLQPQSSNQKLVQNKSSTSISKSRSIHNSQTGLMNQRQGNAPKSYTYSQNPRINQHSQARLVNQTSMMNQKTYQPLQQNFSRNKLSSQVSMQEKKEIPGPTPQRTKQKSVKDIISYYQNKTPSKVPEQVKRTEIKTLNTTKTTPMTRTFTGYQNGNVYSGKPQGTIQFGNARPQRQVQTSHQVMKSQNSIAKKAYVPSRINHHKTNSVDVQSLQHTFGNGISQRKTQPYQQETKKVTRVDSNRGKSKNRKINLDKYNVMRASKIIPNYTKSNLNSYKALNQNPSKQLTIPIQRGMTKNRSYNDLQSYKIKLAEKPKRNLVTNNYSQKFTKSGTQQITRKPKILNEYGISNSRMQVNGSNINRSNQNGFKHSGSKQQRSVRKINLSSYNRSFNLIK